jgi:hypothetical protein
MEYIRTITIKHESLTQNAANILNIQHRPQASAPRTKPQKKKKKKIYLNRKHFQRQPGSNTNQDPHNLTLLTFLSSKSFSL